MTTTQRTTLLGASSILLVATLLSLRSCDVPDARAGAGLGTSDTDNRRRTFTVTGVVREVMTPGAKVPIDLRVTNPYDFDLAVSHLVVSITSVRARGQDASHPCTVADFAVVQLPAKATTMIAPHVTSAPAALTAARLSPPTISLIERAVNQDGCTNATLRLRYSAQGRRR